MAYVWYIHQDPNLSWQFTLAREKLEGRHVPREVFLHALQNAGKNVVKIKREFGKNVRIYLIEKNLDGSIEKSRDNISAEELEKYLDNVPELQTQAK